MLFMKTGLSTIVRPVGGLMMAACLALSPQGLQAQAPNVTEGLLGDVLPSIEATPSCCVHVDVDGDGQPEAVMTGDGLPGTVTSASAGTSGPDVITVGVAGGGEIAGTLDIDGDGDLEALVLSDGLSTASLGISVGSGLDVVFARRNLGGEYLGAVDIDGDGELEAIVRDPGLAAGLATPSDLDGDDPDVVFVGGAASSVFRYGDVDGDGEAEVLLGDPGISAGTISTWNVDSDGDADVQWLGGELLDVVDLDGDGELEALALDAGQAWYGTASLGGTAPDAVFVDVTAYGGVIDVDGDGELEAVFEEASLANGTFPTEALSGADVDLIRVGTASGGHVAGRIDVDGDGELELLVEDPTRPDTTPLTGSAGGTSPDVLFLGGSGSIQALADTDGNGQLEIFLQRQRSPRNAFIHSLPGSPDVDYVWIDNPDPQGQLRAINLDGDNETEVVVETDNLGLAAASRARTHFGTPNDADIIFMGTSGGAEFVGLADIDGDGDTEAIYEAPSLTLLDSRTAIYATPRLGFVFIGTDAGTASVVGVADVNGDGAEQLILETSDGSAGPMQTATLQGHAYTAVALSTSGGVTYGGGVDLDGDGDEELLVEDLGLAAPLALPTSIDGTDPDVVNVGAMGGGEILCSKDVNGDGNPDVLVREPSLVSGVAQTASVGGVDPAVIFAGTALASNITLLTPNSGGSHMLYASINVTWSAPNLSGRVKIELSGDDGVTWQVLKEATDNDGHWNWLVKETPTTLGRLRLSSVDDPAEFDVSDSVFTIPTPSVTLLEPNGGEVWPIDTLQTIRWQMNDIAGPARLEISYDGGATWNEHLAQVNNSGQAGWWPTPPVGSDVRFRVASFHDPSYQDASDASFEVPQPQITVLSPNGGESLVVDALSLLTWQTADVGGALRIELSRDGGMTWEEISAAVLDDGSHRPRIPGPATSSALLRISQSKYPQFFDVSDALFNIVP